MSDSTIESCRICGSADLDSLVDLGDQALTGVFPKSETEHIVARPVELVKCNEQLGGCGLVQLCLGIARSSIRGARWQPMKADRASSRGNVALLSSMSSRFLHDSEEGRHRAFGSLSVGLISTSMVKGGSSMGRGQ